MEALPPALPGQPHSRSPGIHVDLKLGCRSCYILQRMTETHDHDHPRQDYRRPLDGGYKFCIYIYMACNCTYKHIYKYLDSRWVPDITSLNRFALRESSRSRSASS